MDPITIITGIAAGLKMVDQFRDLALKFLGKKVTPPSAIAAQTQSGDAIQIKYQGQIVQEITSSRLDLHNIDEVRLDALRKRIDINWRLFNKHFADLPLASQDERARIELKMERIQAELCADFRELVGLYERILGVSLPDHYSLYEVFRV